MHDRNKLSISQLFLMARNTFQHGSEHFKVTMTSSKSSLYNLRIRLFQSIGWRLETNRDIHKKCCVIIFNFDIQTLTTQKCKGLEGNYTEQIILTQHKNFLKLNITGKQVMCYYSSRHVISHHVVIHHRTVVYF